MNHVCTVLYPYLYVSSVEQLEAVLTKEEVKREREREREREGEVRDGGREIKLLHYVVGVGCSF